MKQSILRVIESILAWCAKRVLARHKPMIIGVTGSVGKTSTKDAALAVVNAKYSVRGTYKNLNHKLGVPLTILHLPTAGMAPLKWLRNILKALHAAYFGFAEYPEVLVLEMGAEQRGDIPWLTTLAPCNIGIVTAIGPAHTEFLGSVEDVAYEKGAMIRHLRASATAILNADDARVAALASGTKAQVVTFGYHETAAVRPLARPTIQTNADDPVSITGIEAPVRVGDTEITIRIKGAVGDHQLYPPLAAAAVGLALQIDAAKIESALAEYTPPNGRMRLIPGIKGTLIIDDSYNASPKAVFSALETVRDLAVQGKTILCLGTMAELGALAESSHIEVGKRVAEVAPDLLVTVGALGKVIASSATESGMDPNSVLSFDYSQDAGKFLQDRIAAGDVILVKGSQMVRMEKIVKELMAEPERAAELLVRHDPSWLRLG